MRRWGYLLPVLPLGFTLCPPEPFSALLLGELCTWKTFQDWLGLPKNTGEPFLAWKGDSGDWRTLPAGEHGLARLGAEGGADIPEAAAAAAEPV